MKYAVILITLFFVCLMGVHAAILAPVGVSPVPVQGGAIDNVTKVLGGHIDDVQVVQRVNNTPSLTLLGTEYESGDSGRTFLLLSQSGVIIENASCFVRIIYPNLTNFVAPALMNYFADGLYYYDFNVPSTLGIYMVRAQCTYVTSNKQVNATSGARLLGGGAGSLSNTNLVDGSYWTSTETLGDNRLIRNNFTFDGLNTSLGSIVGLDVLFTGKRPAEVLDPASDPVNVFLFNYNLSQYDLIGTPFSYSTNDASFTFSVLVNITNYINSSGGANVIMNDSITTAGGDLANTIFSIDQLNLRLDYKQPNSTVTEISGASELHVRNQTETLIGNIVNHTLNVSVNTTVNVTVDIVNITTQLNAISANISLIQTALANLNISVGNLTVNTNFSELNESVTNAINAPRKISLENLGLILLILLLVLTLFIRVPWLYFVTMIFCIGEGIALFSTNVPLGIVVMLIGLIFGALGGFKLRS